MAGVLLALIANDCPNCRIADPAEYVSVEDHLASMGLSLTGSLNPPSANGNGDEFGSITAIIHEIKNLELIDMVVAHFETHKDDKANSLCGP